jgi:hypothetical protein
MRLGPNMNYISTTIFSWRKGVITFDEARERLVWAMDSANFVPEDEQSPEPLPAQTSLTEHAIRRIEQKLNIIIEHEGIALPNELNPRVLSDDVKEMLRERNKIAAIQVHRERTGAGLAEAKRVADEYMEKGDA